MSKTYVRDGMVAVLVSPGIGAGWSTWNKEHPEMVFDRDIVNMILNGSPKDEITQYVTEKYGDVCTLGISDLVVHWLPKGTMFKVSEYDGSESLDIMDHMEFIKA